MYLSLLAPKKPCLILFKGKANNDNLKLSDKKTLSIIRSERTLQAVIFNLQKNSRELLAAKRVFKCRQFISE